MQFDVMLILPEAPVGLFVDYPMSLVRYHLNQSTLVSTHLNRRQ